ncbi:formyltransferase family protein [Clostridium sp.]|uniref:formyltransferase family protein n=1 Tax=Clostridium sp. TaxID=1506 RepID=UPI003D6CAA32
MNKIVFYLMNEKGFHVLENFLKDFGPENIEYIVLAGDKNVRNDYYNEIRNLCVKYSINYLDRRTYIPIFKGYKFVIGWRWIIQDSSKLIVLHDSILPRYRGFAPLVNMLINGESQIGVTALFASNEYDKGDIIKQQTIPVIYPVKIQQAIELVSNLYSKIINDISALIFNNENLVGIPQLEEDATYSLWRDDDDYFINWTSDSHCIRRKVDAVGYPYNGAKTYLNKEIIIIDEVEEYPDLKIENRDSGKIIFMEDGLPIIVCGQGALKIKSARYEDGKSIMPIKKFRSKFGG